MVEPLKKEEKSLTVKERFTLWLVLACPWLVQFCRLIAIFPQRNILDPST
jgi:hypothetical protein